MHKCFTPCIYYNMKHDESKTPRYKIICDIKDGQDILYLSDDEIKNCKYFKTNNDVISKHNSIFSPKNILTEE